MLTQLDNAINVLSEGGYTAVMVRNNSVFTSREKGIRPLLNWIISGEAFDGYSAADKIVGRAAALLYTKLGIKELYAEVISEPALNVLEEYHISVRYGLAVPKIINRKGDGICPMDAAVKHIDSPDQAADVLYNLVSNISAKEAQSGL